MSVFILLVSRQVLEELSGRVCGWCCIRFVRCVCPTACVRMAVCGRIHWDIRCRVHPWACVRVHRCWWVAWVSIHVLLRRAGRGEGDPTDQKNSSRCPANVDGRSKFPLLRTNGQGVLEVCDGDGRGPTDGDQDEDGGHNDETAAYDHHLGL